MNEPKTKSEKPKTECERPENNCCGCDECMRRDEEYQRASNEKNERLWAHLNEGKD